MNNRLFVTGSRTPVTSSRQDTYDGMRTALDGLVEGLKLAQQLAKGQIRPRFMA